MSRKSTNEILLPTNGSVGGGIRSSTLLTTTPEPPTGYPVVRSRGPAALIPKPRCDVAPPAYIRSGRGTRLQVAFVKNNCPAQFTTPIVSPVPPVEPKVFSNPTRVFRASTYFLFPKL